MSAQKKEELVASNPNELQVSGLMSQLAGLETDGFENVTQDDLVMPIFSILQSISPQCDKKKKDSYDPNVSEGNFYNSATKRDTESITCIPIGFTKSYVEWAPRDSGGGFVARYTAENPRVNEAQKVGNKLLLPNGNDLVMTREHYLLVFPEDGSSPYVALFPMKGTQEKHSKRFINEMQSKVINLPDGTVKRAPMAAQKWIIKNGIESNSKGSWYAPSNLQYLGLASEKELGLSVDAANKLGTYLGKVEGSYASSQTETSTDSTVEAVIASME